MIKITTTLKQASGFSTNKAILEITSYTTNETVQLVELTPTMPIVGGKNIQVNFSLYKDLESKTSGASSFSAVDFPYSFNFTASAEDVIDSTYLYNQVSTKLTTLEYTNSIV